MDTEINLRLKIEKLKKYATKISIKHENSYISFLLPLELHMLTCFSIKKLLYTIFYNNLYYIQITFYSMKINLAHVLLHKLYLLVIRKK